MHWEQTTRVPKMELRNKGFQTAVTNIAGYSFGVGASGRRENESADPERGPAWGEVGGPLLSTYCSPVYGEKQYFVG